MTMSDNASVNCSSKLQSEAFVKRAQLKQAWIIIRIGGKWEKVVPFQTLAISTKDITFLGLVLGDEDKSIG